MEQIEAGKRKTSKDRPRGKDGTKRQNSKPEGIQTSTEDPEAKAWCQEAAKKYKRKKNTVPHKYNEPYKDKKGVMNSSTSTSETTSPITDNIDHLSLSSSSNLPTKNDDGMMLEDGYHHHNKFEGAIIYDESKKETSLSTTCRRSDANNKLVCNEEEMWVNENEKNGFPDYNQINNMKMNELGDRVDSIFHPSFNARQLEHQQIAGPKRIDDILGKF